EDRAPSEDNSVMSRRTVLVWRALASRTSTVPAESETRLRGPGLVGARILGCAPMAATVGPFVLAPPGSTSRLAAACADPLNHCLLSPQQVAPLADLGITPRAVALMFVALSCLVMLLMSAVAALLLWRRADNWMALPVALTLILMPSTMPRTMPRTMP